MILVCFNLIAGRGRGKAVAEAIAGRLPSAVLEPRIAHEVQAERWAAADVVLAVGGDGTLRTVVSALLAALPGEIPPIGVVPLGTANLMAQHVGMIPHGLFRPEPLDMLGWFGPAQRRVLGRDTLTPLGIEKRAAIAVDAVHRRQLRHVD
ncbi:MAG: acylglycerol kinase family protein, partial [Planctomycetota bacterium]